MANRLFIGNRRFSSWSLRGWLAVKLAGLEVEEVVIPLAGGTTPEVFALPGRSVPYLEHDGCGFGSRSPSSSIAPSFIRRCGPPTVPPAHGRA